MKIITPLILTFLLTACGVYPHKPVTARQQEVIYKFPSAVGPDGLSAAEKAGLEKALAQVPADAMRVALLDAGPATTPMTMQAVEHALYQHGFTSDTILWQDAATSHDGLTLHVRFRSIPDKSACNHLLSEGLLNQENSVATHMGCSNAVNTRAMVANPDDLLLPRSNPGAETDTAVRAIGIYNGTVTAPPPPAQSMDSRTTDDE